MAKKTKKELEEQFQNLRHEILNGIMCMGGIIKQLQKKMKDMETAIKDLGSDIKINNDD